MESSVKRYRIRKNRMLRGHYEGFREGTDGLCLEEQKEYHVLEYLRLDSSVPSCAWGRLTVDAELPEQGILVIRAYASDEDRLCPEKSVRIADATDTLLYEHNGRYLWFCLEVWGKGPGVIRELSVDVPGDTFIQTFPEIYREHGSFFHRYLSIFSSIYMDFQQKLEQAEHCLDPDTAPADFLPVLAGWLGIDVSESALGEEVLRLLVRRAHDWNRYKGTKRVVKEVAGAVLGCGVMVVERNLLQDLTEEDRQIYDHLYGDTASDVTILAAGAHSETERNQLLYLLDQFKPADCRVKLVFLQPSSILDGYCYLDHNALLHQTFTGAADRGLSMDQGCCLA